LGSLFFFDQTSAALRRSYPNLYGNGGGGGGNLAKYAWYALIETVSSSGHFNKMNDKTAFENATNANLWQVFTWLDYDKARNDNASK
jgi:hypothetical protein